MNMTRATSKWTLVSWSKCLPAKWEATQVSSKMCISLFSKAERMKVFVLKYLAGIQGRGWPSDEADVHWRNFLKRKETTAAPLWKFSTLITGPSSTSTCLLNSLVVYYIYIFYVVVPSENVCFGVAHLRMIYPAIHVTSWAQSLNAGHAIKHTYIIYLYIYIYIRDICFPRHDPNAYAYEENAMIQVCLHEREREKSIGTSRCSVYDLILLRDHVRTSNAIARRCLLSISTVHRVFTEEYSTSNRITDILFFSPLRSIWSGWFERTFTTTQLRIATRSTGCFKWNYWNLLFFVPRAPTKIVIHFSWTSQVL